MGLLVGFPIEKIKSCLSLENFGVPKKKMKGNEYFNVKFIIGHKDVAYFNRGQPG